MIAGRLTEFAGPLEANVYGGDAEFRGLSTDTRGLEKNNLFVALQGERFDGHDYLAQAEAAGAGAVMVHREVTTRLPGLRVADTRLGLGVLARTWRERFSVPVVGVTGSNGKTTVKEMVAAILLRRGPALVTQGNLNNEIGVPLTLVRLGSEHWAAVVEMGASGPGEIAYLTSLVIPNVGILTNAGPAHLEGFGSLRGVAQAKGELFSSLPADGVAVINADDAFAPLWRRMAGSRTQFCFGFDSAAEFHAEPDSISLVHKDGEWVTRFRMRTPGGQGWVELCAAGVHNVRNALAAAAAATAVGLDWDDIVVGLSEFRGVGGRARMVEGAGGLRLVDDSYNANPASFQSAIETLVQLPGPHWVVLGEMAELGADSQALHEAVGRSARAAGVTRLYAIGGDLAQAAASAFGEGGRAFANQDNAVAVIQGDLDQLAGGPSPCCLVKGSRSAGMDRVVKALRAGASSCSTI